MIPKKRRARVTAEELIPIDDYITEVIVPKDSELIGTPFRELDQRGEKLDVEIVGIVRDKRRILAALRHEVIRSEDILIVESGPQELDKFITDTKLKLAGEGKEKASLLRSEDTTMMEAVVQSRFTNGGGKLLPRYDSRIGTTFICLEYLAKGQRFVNVFLKFVFAGVTSCYFKGTLKVLLNWSCHWVVSR